MHVLQHIIANQMMMTRVTMTMVTMMTTVHAQQSINVQHAQPHSRHLNILPSLVAVACGRRAQPGLIMAAQLVSWLAGLMSVRQITDVASLAQRSSQQ